MFRLNSVSFLLALIFVICESALEDNLSKCKINDGDCAAGNIETVLHIFSKSGDKDRGIPVVDPIELKNMVFSIPNALNLTLVKGNLRGIRDCKVKKFVADVESEHAHMDMICESLTIKGQYTAFATSPAIVSLFGGETAKGDGNFKLYADNLNLGIDFSYYIQQRDDDIYIKCKQNKAEYTYDMKNMKFNVDGFMIGSQDASELASTLLTQNWKFLMQTFGKTFTDRAMELVFEFVHKFFDTVPCKHYISDDLTKYARP